MCGISAIFSFGENMVNIDKFHQMNNLIKHRGPDDEGYYFKNEDKEFYAYGEDTIDEIKKNKNVKNINELKLDNCTIALAHRRLSILDLSENGHQPFTYGDYLLSFNGEIYNYIEIREELIDRGYRFTTATDTEVLIKAYDCYGTDAVKKFNGMWAFVLYDKVKNQIFCSRDRFGVKPLYYSNIDGCLVIGSEIKQLLYYTQKKEINERALFDFIQYSLSDEGNETFFEDIFALEPATNMITDLNTGNIKIERYWELKKVEERTLDYFIERFNKSITYRLRSDVEIGSCLSGGLDSSSIVTKCCKNLKNPKLFKTFTSCYDDESVDERFYSRKVAENCNCQNFEIFPKEEDLNKEFKKLVWYQEQPFASLSIYASWKVMECASFNSTKVLLDGQGGDEALLGYERYYVFYLKELLKKGKFKLAKNEYVKMYQNSKLDCKNLLLYYFYFNYPILNKLKKKSRLKYLNSNFINKNEKKSYYKKYLKFASLDDCQKSALKNSIQHLLRYEDRNSMAHSIETRLPFLDYQLVETAYSMDSSLKIKDGWTKYALRKSMEADMPEEVTYRKNKLGFSVPQKKWMESMENYIGKLLENPKSEKYFNIQNIRECFKDNENNEIMFKFLMIETWMRVFDLT